MTAWGRALALLAGGMAALPAISASAAERSAAPVSSGPPTALYVPSHPSAKAATVPARRPATAAKPPPAHAAPVAAVPLIPPAPLPARLGPPPTPRPALPLETDLQPLSPAPPPPPAAAAPVPDAKPATKPPAG